MGTPEPCPRRLADAVRLSPDQIVGSARELAAGAAGWAGTVLVILAAGKGTRFGKEPKCIQPVLGRPLARHSIDAFRQAGGAKAIGLVGYEYQNVADGLGEDTVCVRSADPAGGTALAAYEVFCVAGLLEANPLLVVTMGDRVVPATVFRRLLAAHQEGANEADLTFLSALYPPPRNRGKGRVVRDARGRVLRIVEQRDIDSVTDVAARQELEALREGNCPLYAIRAATLHRHLEDVTNDNAQRQYYLTDLVEAIGRAGGDVRTVTVTPGDAEYEVLCADVTRPEDVARIEAALARLGAVAGPTEVAHPPGPQDSVETLARAIAANRPAGQSASIARQLEMLVEEATRAGLGFRPDRPVAIGLSGGRLRIAFMHPDMGRFFGPAWQMPLGAGDDAGSEQVVMILQPSDDQRIHLHPVEARYRERTDWIPADAEAMYPDASIQDCHAYEVFGTSVSVSILRLLGYATNEDAQRLQAPGRELPPPSLAAANNMRRPFCLVANALASLRTARDGASGVRIRERLGRPDFGGLRIVSTGSIPEGGFSSSSAVTMATLNALNAAYDLQVAPARLVELGCQAEYGTGVRAGSLDQATVQLGRAGEGALISSNPRDQYRVFGTYPVPTEQIRILFPSSVPRDREAWRWSWGAYAAAPAPGRLTTVEVRKMTGKAAEIAAWLTRWPVDTDFFRPIKEELVRDGTLSREHRAWIASVLLKLPLRVTQAELRARFEENRDWLIDDLVRHEGLKQTAGREYARDLENSLLAGWRDPVLRRTTVSGDVVEEAGMPLRAMVAYLFGEVAKNFRLIHHPEEWIECVASSQRGDRCVDIDPQVLPARAALESTLDWEGEATGAGLLDRWLDRFGATPFDFNRGLEDAVLSAAEPPEFDRLEGTNFFRGLALIDLAEAMLVRAFGSDAVAVRVNAAGQGDFFQVHVDRQKAEVDEVKEFIRRAFYRRFGLRPETEFVEVHPGGGALGVRLERCDQLSRLAERLRALAKPG